MCNFNTDPSLYINYQDRLSIIDGHLYNPAERECVARFADDMQAQNCLEESGWVRDDTYGNDWLNPRFHEPPVHSPGDPPPKMTPEIWQKRITLVNELNEASREYVEKRRKGIPHMLKGLDL